LSTNHSSESIRKENLFRDFNSLGLPPTCWVANCFGRRRMQAVYTHSPPAVNVELFGHKSRSAFPIRHRKLVNNWSKESDPQWAVIVCASRVPSLVIKPFETANQFQHRFCPRKSFSRLCVLCLLLPKVEGPGVTPGFESLIPIRRSRIYVPHLSRATSWDAQRSAAE
jgi:hypothetical protein